MSAARVRREPTLLKSTVEAISRCPWLYRTAKMTLAAGAGRASARTARRRDAWGKPMLARTAHSTAGTMTLLPTNGADDESGDRNTLCVQHDAAGEQGDAGG
jgi:hypothetical protein